MSFTKQLIEEVRKYPCIWNKSIEEYRNQNTRDNAWEKISEELNVTAEKLKGEWKKLQDCFRQAMLRRKTKSGDAARRMKAWKYEELMSFLLPDLTARQIQSNVDVAEQSERDNSLTLTHEDDHNEEIDELEAQMLTNIKKRKCIKNISKSQNDQEDNFGKIPTFLQDKNQTKKPARDLDFFFASACESTKCLPRHLQLKVKAEVMEAVINAEMESLHHEQHTNTATTLSSASFSSTSSPVYTTHTRTPSPPQLFYPSTYGQNQAQEDISQRSNGNEGSNENATHFTVG